MRDFAKQIKALGGHREGIAGGVLIVHVPRKLNLDIQQELKRIQQNLKGAATRSAARRRT